MVSKEQRRAVAKERNNLLAAERKAEAERVQTKRAVTRAECNLRRQANANAAVAEMQEQIAYSKHEKETAAQRDARAAERSAAHTKLVAEEEMLMRR